MAKNIDLVLLGYEDALITEKHQGQVNHTVNKIGGKANFPSNFTKFDKNPICNLCELPSRLVVQIYAPLENAMYHRTLYLFACINNNCGNRSKSWRCMRIQTEKNVTVEREQTKTCIPQLSTTDWCVDADDWGEDDSNTSLVEENYNTIKNTSDNKESSSFDESVWKGFVQLSVDDKNANTEGHGGAVASVYSPMATAEIEGDEEIITVESPTVPRTTLAALLQEATSPPRTTSSGSDTTPFVSFFMSVWPEEEDVSSADVFDNHVKELLAEYKRKDVDFLASEQCGQKINKPEGGGVGDTDMAAEEYEKSIPLHGDKMFHHFLTKIKANPNQLLRYNREGSPLLLYPLGEQLKRCQHCRGELTFEFQLVPTIISKLRLECDPNQCARLEFGTVLVYTCKKSCWSTNDFVKEEVVVLQRENF